VGSGVVGAVIGTASFHGDRPRRGGPV